jgi:hypothetical protein
MLNTTVSFSSANFELNSDHVKKYWEEILFPILKDKFANTCDLDPSWISTKVRYSKWSVFRTMEKSIEYSDSLVMRLEEIQKELVDDISEASLDLIKYSGMVQPYDVFYVVARMIELNRVLSLKETLAIDQKLAKVDEMFK